MAAGRSLSKPRPGESQEVRGRTRRFVVLKSMTWQQEGRGQVVVSYSGLVVRGGAIVSVVSYSGLVVRGGAIVSVVSYSGLVVRGGAIVSVVSYSGLVVRGGAIVSGIVVVWPGGPWRGHSARNR